MTLLADLPADVRRALPRLIGFRFISNVGVRYPYSFLPALARGAGFSIEEMSAVLSARDFTGALAPAAGRIADRGGSGKLMSAATFLGVAALAAAAVGRWGLAIGFVLFGLSKIAFDVAMNSWLGDHVPYERRGRAMGLVELSWSASALIGLPTLDILIDQIGWNAASVLLAVLGLPLAVAIARSEGREPPSVHRQEVHRRPHVDAGILATIAAFCLMTSSSQLLIIGHGLWLEDTYHLDAAGVGIAVIAIGVVEAVGSSTSSGLTDRMGKRRAIALGSFVMGLAATALTVFPAPRMTVGLILLALAFLGFEFAIVSSLPLISELDPGARAQMMGWALGLSTVLRAVGSFVGGRLYVNQGFGTLMGVTAAGCALSILMLVTLVPEPANG
ncbi:MAG: MFS transporter [Actinomycetota bacterium]|nr:MFS transporter [Actinomycetota bacterium]